MADGKPCATPMCKGRKLSKDNGAHFDNSALYRSIIGGLQYVTLSRPDIAFAVNKLSQFLQSPTINHWSACKLILRYLKGTATFGLYFPILSSGQKSLEIVGCSDAD